MNDRPKVGMGVIVRKEDKVLLYKRRNTHGEGTWGFPGGHLEYGETFEQCARREVFEEAGIQIKNIRYGALTNDVFEKERKHYITIYMTSEYDSGEVQLKEPEKSEGWEWFEWNNLPQPLFLPIQSLLKQNFSPFKS